MLNPRANGPAPHRAALVLVPLVFGCALTSCNEAANDTAHAAIGDCPVRVIVRHAAEPDGAMLADLERTHVLDLEPVDSITLYLRVYTLSVGVDDDCGTAVERLRRDERVRSVDLDARRAPHDDR